MFWIFVAPKNGGKPCSSSPHFSGPFGEVGEVFVLAKSLGGDSGKVKALFKAGFGPGLRMFRRFVAPKHRGKPCSSSPHFFRTVWGSR